jgi:erythronate-4-phosphate dehydrogenase
MEKTAEDILAEHLTTAKAVGLVGVGKLGTQLRELAEKKGVKTLLCDPPRNLDEATELGESFFNLWGNGMGGCELTGAGLETFLPLDSLAAADVICIQVPLTDEKPFPTVGMITAAFLSKCRPDACIICFSSREVVAEDVRGDSRIHYIAG